MDAGRGGDVDDAAGGAVLHSEVRGCGTDELEGRGAVQGDDGVPLLVGHLVDHAVPGIARVVDDDVDLAVAKVCGALDDFLDVLSVGHVAGYGDGLAAGLVDVVGDGAGLLCGGVSEGFEDKGG